MNAAESGKFPDPTHKCPNCGATECCAFDVVKTDCGTCGADMYRIREPDNALRDAVIVAATPYFLERFSNGIEVAQGAYVYHVAAIFADQWLAERKSRQ